MDRDIWDPWNISMAYTSCTLQIFLFKWPDDSFEDLVNYNRHGLLLCSVKRHIEIHKSLGHQSDAFGHKERVAEQRGNWRGWAWILTWPSSYIGAHMYGDNDCDSKDGWLGYTSFIHFNLLCGFAVRLYLNQSTGIKFGIFGTLVNFWWTGHAKDPSRSDSSSPLLAFACAITIYSSALTPSRMTNDVALGAVVVCEALCASWPPVSVVECDGLGDLLCTKLVLFKILFKESVFGN